MSVNITAHSAINMRDTQEDSYSYFSGLNPKNERLHIILVADGLGGHSHGELASQETVDIVLQTAVMHWSHSILTLETWQSKILEYLQAAQDALYHHSLTSMRFDNRDTTLAGAFYFENKNTICVFSVGDSSVSLFTPDKETPLLTERQGEDNVVWSTIATFQTGQEGLRPAPYLSTWNLENIDSFTLIAYTDGLDQIMNQQTGTTIHTKDPKFLAEELCEEGVTLSTDNCTIVALIKRP